MREGVLLSDWTTLGVGGPAHYFDEVEDPAPSLEWARARNLPVLILGQGSNLLVADAGFDGLVLRLTSSEVRVEKAGSAVHVTAAAGVVWDELVARTVEEDWAGIECLSGIPGLAGAAPIQNIGAHGQEVAGRLVRVAAMDRATGVTHQFASSACDFDYRTSRFKQAEAGRWVVTEIELALSPGGGPTLTYESLRARLASDASLAQVRAAVLELRASKSMVIDEKDANRRSAGSFFVNPVVSSETADRVAAALGGDAPRFRQPDGRVKLAAAWLIERSGLSKGWGEGPVGLSTHHTLAIVNRGGATAADVLAFARRVRDHVRQVTGVELVPEPVLVGFGGVL
jgi:UDP-N-acetylmuramate dehydrogenase